MKGELVRRRQMNGKTCTGWRAQLKARVRRRRRGISLGDRPDASTSEKYRMIVESHSEGDVNVPVALLEAVPVCALILLDVGGDGDLARSDLKLVPNTFRLIIAATGR